MSDDGRASERASTGRDFVRSVTEISYTRGPEAAKMTSAFGVREEEGFIPEARQGLSQRPLLCSFPPLSTLPAARYWEEAKWQKLEARKIFAHRNRLGAGKFAVTHCFFFCFVFAGASFHFEFLISCGATAHLFCAFGRGVEVLVLWVSGFCFADWNFKIKRHRERAPQVRW